MLISNICYEKFADIYDVWRRAGNVVSFISLQQYVKVTWLYPLLFSLEIWIITPGIHFKITLFIPLKQIDKNEEILQTYQKQTKEEKD